MSLKHFYNCRLHIADDCFKRDLKVHVVVANSYNSRFRLFAFRLYAVLKTWWSMDYFSLIL